MTGYHTRWVLPEPDAQDPDRIAIRQALAFGKAVCDRRTALDMTIAEVALRAGLTADEVEYIEEGGTEPTVARTTASAWPGGRVPAWPGPPLFALGGPIALTMT